MKGILKRELGTGRNTWLVQPIPEETEGIASVAIDWEDAQKLTDKEISLVVEYEVFDLGHKLFKKGHYQEWLLAKLPEIDQIVEKRELQDKGWSSLQSQNKI